MSESTVTAFFYGLFMDEQVLRGAGVVPRAPRRAVVAGYALRIGARATMVRDFGGQVYGMLFEVTHAELDQLYGAPGLEAYRAEGVLALLEDGGQCAAAAYNLPLAPGADEVNPAYAEKLRAVLTRLGFPAAYVGSVV